MIKALRDNDPVNVYDEPLLPCSMDPLTGFFRDGCCNTSIEDAGSHTVCIVATEDFLKFSKMIGNDLSTPIPEYEFPGVKPGDKWCLCAPRWMEAYNNGMAPNVYLPGTHKGALEHVPLELLEKFAVDIA